MDAARHEHFEHESDVGLRGVGPTLDSAFEQAAHALTDVVTSSEAVKARGPEVDVTCEAPDAELLLVDWLNALIAEMSIRRMLFARFEVRIRPSPGGLSLSGRAWGEPVDAARHAPAVEPKGATHAELSVRQDATGSWLAQCVVDV